MSETSKTRENILCQYLPQMKKKGLYAAGTGGGQKEGKINLIDVVFDYEEELTIEKSRQLLVESVESLLKIVNNNPKYRESFEEYPISVIPIHIGIIGKTPEKIEPNTVEFVSLLQGTVYYKIDSEVPRFPPLITVHKESYETAKALVTKGGF